MPAGFRKSHVVFNLHRAIATKTSTVIVVEGFFDVIAVHQAGYPVVVGLGSTRSRHQADLLTSHFHRVLLMLDGDPPGQEAALAINRSLMERVPVTVTSRSTRLRYSISCLDSHQIAFAQALALSKSRAKEAIDLSSSRRANPRVGLRAPTRVFK